MESVFKGAIGQKIILEVGINISAATTRTIKYRKPNGPLLTWAAAEETTTSISFTTTLASDLNKTGTWKFQAFVITPTWTEHGEIDRLQVKPPL